MAGEGTLAGLKGLDARQAAQLTCCASLDLREVRLGNEAGRRREAVGAASALT